MVRFSLGGEDDNQGPSSYSSKRRRILQSIQQAALERRRNRGVDLVVPGRGGGGGQEQSEPESSAGAEEEDLGVHEVEDLSSDNEGGEYGHECEGEEEEENGRNQGEDRRRTVETQSSRDGGEGSAEKNCDLAGYSGSGSAYLIVSDPEVFDCPICLEHLTIPVFQCDNGHIACSSCCVKIRNKCASCSWPIGYNRCRAMEMILESLAAPCPNLKHGCTLKIPCSRRRSHMEMCTYSPCSCPFPACNFIGFSKHLYSHFAAHHSASTKQFSFGSLFSVTLSVDQNYQFLQEKGESVIFVLNRGVDRLGSLVNVVCLGPTSFSKKFEYNLVAKSGDGLLKLRSPVESFQTWSERCPEKGYLLVPGGLSQPLKTGVCIRRLP